MIIRGLPGWLAWFASTASKAGCFVLPWRRFTWPSILYALLAGTSYLHMVQRTMGPLWHSLSCRRSFSLLLKPFPHVLQGSMMKYDELDVSELQDKLKTGLDALQKREGNNHCFTFYPLWFVYLFVHVIHRATKTARTPPKSQTQLITAANLPGLYFAPSCGPLPHEAYLSQTFLEDQNLGRSSSHGRRQATWHIHPE